MNMTVLRLSACTRGFLFPSSKRNIFTWLSIFSPLWLYTQFHAHVILCISTLINPQPCETTKMLAYATHHVPYVAPPTLPSLPQPLPSPAPVAGRGPAEAVWANPFSLMAVAASQPSSAPCALHLPPFLSHGGKRSKGARSLRRGALAGLLSALSSAVVICSYIERGRACGPFLPLFLPRPTNDMAVAAVLLLPRQRACFTDDDMVEISKLAHLLFFSPNGGMVIYIAASRRRRIGAPHPSPWWRRSLCLYYRQ